MILNSEDSLARSAQLRTQSPPKIAQNYVALPMIPYGEKVIITKLGCVNFDVINRKRLGLVKYRDFRKCDAQSFPKCKDPKSEYTDSEQVSPIIVFIQKENGTVVEHKTPQLVWFPLAHLVCGIMLKQGITQTKVFPVQVTLDEQNQWIAALMNLVGSDILNSIKVQ